MRRTQSKAGGFPSLDSKTKLQYMQYFGHKVLVENGVLRQTHSDMVN